MTDGVMRDPAPENIEGRKVVRHEFGHGVDWKVNVSHVLVAIAVVAVLLYVARSGGIEDAADDEEGGLS